MRTVAWLRALASACLLAAAIPVSTRAAPAGLTYCEEWLTHHTVGEAPWVRRPEQDVFPKRDTGVAHFYNFTDKEYALSIGGQWRSLHAGNRFAPYEVWFELPPGEYAYSAHHDGGEVRGSTYVFQTLTWPAVIGTPYQAPTPPPPTGKYAPPSPSFSTLVFRNSSQRDVSVAVFDEGAVTAFALHARDSKGPTEVILFVRPRTVDFRVYYDPGLRGEAAAAGCAAEYDAAVSNGAFNSKTVRLGQVALVEVPE